MKEVHEKRQRLETKTTKMRSLIFIQFQDDKPIRCFHFKRMTEQS